MTFLRAIAAALIVLGCAAFSQTCLITTMMADRTVDCCEHEEQPLGQSGEKQCSQCATLESGVDRVAPELVAVIEPVAVVDEVLSALVALALQRAKVAPELDTSPPAALTPIWHFVARTALPVRGPSLVA